MSQRSGPDLAGRVAGKPDLNGIFGGAGCRPLSNHVVRADGHRRSDLIRSDPVLLIMRNIVVDDLHAGRAAVPTLHKNPKACLASNARSRQCLIDHSQMIHASRGILVKHTDKIDRSACSYGDLTVGAIHGKVAEIDSSGVGDQDLRRDRASRRKTGCVLNDTAGGRRPGIR